MRCITRPTASGTTLESFWSHKDTKRARHSSLYQPARMSDTTKHAFKAKAKVFQREYLVGRILSHKVGSRSRNVIYKVEWADYPYYTWESRTTLAECYGLIDLYKRKLDGDFKFQKKSPLFQKRSTRTKVIPAKVSVASRPNKQYFEQREPYRIIGATEINGQRHVVVQWSKCDLKADIVPEVEANSKWPQLVAQSFDNWYKGIRVESLMKLAEVKEVNKKEYFLKLING